jgi:hypothetical protein
MTPGAWPQKWQTVGVDGPVLLIGQNLVAEFTQWPDKIARFQINK